MCIKCVCHICSRSCALWLVVYSVVLVFLVCTQKEDCVTCSHVLSCALHMRSICFYDDHTQWATFIDCFVYAVYQKEELQFLPHSYSICNGNSVSLSVGLCLSHWWTLLEIQTSVTLNVANFWWHFMCRVFVNNTEHQCLCETLHFLYAVTTYGCVLSLELWWTLT